MNLISPAFLDGETIPKKYSQFGENINPPLTWNEAPDDTQSFALIMEDPDVPPAAGVPIWDHWIIWNIPATLTVIPEAWSVVGIQGKGTRGMCEYSGPKPPDREHRYFFYLYALDTLLPLVEGSTKPQLFEAMNGHILSKATLMGKFFPQESILEA